MALGSELLKGAAKIGAGSTVQAATPILRSCDEKNKMATCISRDKSYHLMN
jgi:hypothetical protein